MTGDAPSAFASLYMPFSLMVHRNNMGTKTEAAMVTNRPEMRLNQNPTFAICGTVT